ncbi:MAG: putative heme-binding protein [Rhodospirillales bacterium]|nr:putative heme-binding protein [Rhodospirillales bacterium]
MRTELFAFALILGGASASVANAAPSAAELEAAGNLFSITCSSSFCHGEGGIGARGPSLRNRNFPPNYVRNTIMNGRSGTPMPSFKDALTPNEIAMIAGYVMSLSPENHTADTGSAEAVAAPAAIPLSDQALRGSDLFFDQTRSSNCAACHSYGSKGGLVGPDLSTVAGKPASAIYQSIIKPAVSSDAYPAITVTTRDGRKFAGIKRDQNDQQVTFFDVSSAPPVLRSLYFADGIKVEPSTGGALYTHKLDGYSKTDIADLIAFLKSAGGDNKVVTAQDLASQ